MLPWTIPAPRLTTERNPAQHLPSEPPTSPPRLALMGEVRDSGIQEDIAQLDFPNLGDRHHQERQFGVQEMLGDLCVGEGQGSLS